MDTSGIRRMGQERWKYLDMANMTFASGDYIKTIGYINSFLETIDEKSTAGLKIQQEFDIVEKEKQQNLKKLEQETHNLGYLEQKDMQTQGRDIIEINSVYDRKTICWTISIKYGLFNE